MTNNNVNNCEDLIKQAKEFSDDCLYTYKELYNMHDKFKRRSFHLSLILYITLSIPIVLKVAGLLNLISVSHISGITDSLILFIIACINLVLFKINNIYTKELGKNDYKKLGNEYKFLYKKLGIFMGVASYKVNETKLYEFLNEHNQEKKKLDDKITDINIPKWAYTEAKKQIDNGEHLADKDVNNT